MSDRTIRIKYAQSPNAIPRRSWRGELAANAAGAIFVGTERNGGESLLVGAKSGIRAVASEDILPGHFVHLWFANNSIQAKLATVVGNAVCHGFAIDSGTSGDSILVCTLVGAIVTNARLSPFTVDREYYLSLNPGIGSLDRTAQFLGNSITDGFIFNPRSI